MTLKLQTLETKPLCASGWGTVIIASLLRSEAISSSTANLCGVEGRAARRMLSKKVEALWQSCNA